jgi:1-deoxy-D-xylulose-5-phosphate synthase
VFAIDRAGIVGEDGPTHHGVFDISFLRHIPNMVVMEPKDERELQMMMELALEHEGPVAIRYPRGNVYSIETNTEKAMPFKIGEAEVVKEGKDVAIIALGNTVYTALSAAVKLEKNGVSTMVINARFAKPLDNRLIAAVASMVPRIITIEENALQGGFGSAVIEYLHELEMPQVRIRRIGIPDIFIEQGKQTELRKKYGLDEEGIYQAVLSISKEPSYTF